MQWRRRCWRICVRRSPDTWAHMQGSCARARAPGVEPLLPAPLQARPGRRPPPLPRVQRHPVCLRLQRLGAWLRGGGLKVQQRYRGWEGRELGKLAARQPNLPLPPPLPLHPRPPSAPRAQVRNCRIMNADNGLFFSWVHRSSILGEPRGGAALRVPLPWRGTAPLVRDQPLLAGRRRTPDPPRLLLAPARRPDGGGDAVTRQPQPPRRPQRAPRHRHQRGAVGAGQAVRGLRWRGTGRIVLPWPASPGGLRACS